MVIVTEGVARRERIKSEALHSSALRNIGAMRTEPISNGREQQENHSMPKYSLSCRVTVSAYTNVEADSLEEAIEAAVNREVVLSGRGGEDADEEWIIDDADGLPEDIHEA